MCSSCSENGIVICTLRACGTDVCSLPRYAGPCRAAIPAYYFNQNSRRCEKFLYGGCQDNGNKFDTLENCQRRCGPSSEFIVDNDDSVASDNDDDDTDSSYGGNGVMEAINDLLYCKR